MVDLAQPRRDQPQGGRDSPRTRSPAPTGGPWSGRGCRGGQLLVVRRAAIDAEAEERARARLAAHAREGCARCRMRRPARPKPRSYRVVHRTVYRYAQPVERSSHFLKLVPVHDRVQRLLEHSLVLMLDGDPFDAKHTDFERRLRQPCAPGGARAALHASSCVEARSHGATSSTTDPLEFKPLHARRLIPLVWMPWQREMMAPYLLPRRAPGDAAPGARRLRDDLRRAKRLRPHRHACWT